MRRPDAGTFQPWNCWAALDEVWFRRHQNLLLRLLNGPLSPLLRPLLGVDSSLPLVRIGPSYHFLKLHERYCGVFFARWKHSQAIARAFWPLLAVGHLADLLILNRLAPSASLQLDQYTFYPDPHPEVSSCDGFVYVSGLSTWTAIRQASSGAANDAGTSLSLFLTAYSAPDYFTQLSRVIIQFDTSALSGATIQSVTLELYGISKSNTFTSPPGFSVVSVNPTSYTGLTAADYDYARYGTTQFASISYTSFVTSQYNQLALNTAGIGYINKTGVTPLALRLNPDISGVSPWENSKSISYEIASADSSGTSTDPRLIVVFEMPPQQFYGSEQAAILSVSNTQLNAYMDHVNSYQIQASVSSSVSLLFSDSDSAQILATPTASLSEASYLTGATAGVVGASADASVTVTHYYEKAGYVTAAVQAIQDATVKRYEVKPPSGLRTGILYERI